MPSGVCTVWPTRHCSGSESTALPFLAKPAISTFPSPSSLSVIDAVSSSSMSRNFTVTGSVLP